MKYETAFFEGTLLGVGKKREQKLPVWAEVRPKDVSSTMSKCISLQYTDWVRTVLSAPKSLIWENLLKSAMHKQLELGNDKSSVGELAP